jgi:hypothetical protein
MTRLAGVILLVALAACGPAPRETIPTRVLDHQDPGADTSHHSVLSHSASYYHDPDDHRWDWLSWLKVFQCNAGRDRGHDLGGAAIIGAVALVVRRRRRA